MKLILCLILSFFTGTALAKSTETLPVDPTETVQIEPTSPSTPTSETTESPEIPPTVVPPPKPMDSNVLRGLSSWNVHLHLSTLSTWLPFKYGGSVGYHLSDRWTMEGEITTRSLGAGILGVDFGKVTDRRYGVQARWFPGRSFNVIMGIFRSEFSAEIGNSIASNLAGTPQSDVVSFQTFGPLVGFGNRWQWNPGISFGVDWFVMYVPISGQENEDVLQYVTNGSDRSDLDKVSKWVRNIPQFDIFKFTVGYNF